jgi:NAD(P)-dependent dehydrogenase (short-subunit alcohol dehydrogenase family)
VSLSTDRPVAVVTGASSGIGRATARQLVEAGWQVIGVGRDPDRIAQATREIEAAVAAPGNFTMLQADLSLLSDVKKLAGQIAALTPRVDVLINNAGGMRDRRIMTAEGLEAVFATNYLAPFLLTRELKPLLDAAVAAAPAGAVRVIAVSSSGHRNSPGLDFDDLQGNAIDLAPGTAYCHAKLANLLFTRELARRWGSDGIVAQAMHPGVVTTNFVNHADEGMRAWLATRADKLSPDQPAETLVWLATDPEGARDPGRYFHNKAEETPDARALDDTAAQRLWSESEKILTAHGY